MWSGCWPLPKTLCPGVSRTFTFFLSSCQALPQLTLQNNPPPPSLALKIPSKVPVFFFPLPDLLELPWTPVWDLESF